MKLDLRTLRCKTTPVILGHDLTIGWECGRPFIALDQVERGEGTRYDVRRFALGGCRLDKGVGCEYECAGCYAYTAALESAWMDTDETVDEDPAVINARYDDCASLGFTIGHGPRCAYPDGWAYVRCDDIDDDLVVFTPDQVAEYTLNG